MWLLTHAGIKGNPHQQNGPQVIISHGFDPVIPEYSSFCTTRLTNNLLHTEWQQGARTLTHWGWDKMAAISQPTFSDAFFLNKNVRISIKISLKFVPKGPINNIPALVQIMAWHRPGDKPLSEPMMVKLLTHICALSLNGLVQCA